MNSLITSHFMRGRAAAYGLSLACLATFSGFAAAQTPAAKPSAAALSDEIIVEHYMCSEHNVKVPVTYIQTAGGNYYAVLTVEGKQISMVRQQAAAAKDAAADKAGKTAPPQYYYYSLDEQNGYRWYPNGNKGRLTFLAADDSAKEITVYDACEIADKL